MNDIRAVRSAIMAGEARALKAMDDWEARFFAPDGVMQLRLALMMMSPEALANIKRNAPDVWKQIEELAKGGQNGK